MVYQGLASWGSICILHVFLSGQNWAVCLAQDPMGLAWHSIGIGVWEMHRMADDDRTLVDGAAFLVWQPREHGFLYDR